eukprot:CAMPEP_0197665312 /NCGR_PEP_ID=MMETSP1338-20131121/59150_1 /TAXON_ID=43686 ORGANISM="Pelagodinium beii, Strain RCC1491" /NCGR_SAMPLE_ID=MMETSP1338 /ASSEMBLY_ACC=CAM_ASM_000754 /LENGTH=374 /DNA_ID=CAMNT_0043244093 /DNA_START=80 /DNA_END=1204 /DNA_ORIENTATION=+
MGFQVIQVLWPMLLQSTLATRVEYVQHAKLGPDSAECKACLQPCEDIWAPDDATIEAWEKRNQKAGCKRKCITGGVGMPVGPCREEPKTVTVSDIFNDPVIITDRQQIFSPRSNQLEWLKLLRGQGDSYVQKGSFAFALKQINHNGHVIVLMFKESDSLATQFFVDGRAYAEELLKELKRKPSLFFDERRPSGEAKEWKPHNPCEHENPAECCCQWQDRKFMTGYFYDRKYAGAGCNGQSIDNCGDELNPNPGMMWFNRDKTGKVTWTDWKGNADTEEAKQAGAFAKSIGLDPEFDYDWDNELATKSTEEGALWHITQLIKKAEKADPTTQQEIARKEALLKSLLAKKDDLVQQMHDANSKWAAPPSFVGGHGG